MRVFTAAVVLIYPLLFRLEQAANDKPRVV